VALTELTAAAFGVASAASWGAGDFCGGVATKRAGSFPVVMALTWWARSLRTGSSE
jgi:hypothetical protein